VDTSETLAASHGYASRDLGSEVLEHQMNHFAGPASGLLSSFCIAVILRRFDRCQDQHLEAVVLQAIIR
jgi:hypothetical protein